MEKEVEKLDENPYVSQTVHWFRPAKSLATNPVGGFFLLSHSLKRERATGYTELKNTTGDPF